MQRSHLLFTNSIHSKDTLRVYQYSLDKFIEHFKLRDYDSLASMDSKMFQTIVEDYLMEKKKEGKSRSTLQTPISALELFFQQIKKIALYKRKVGADSWSFGVG